MDRSLAVEAINSVGKKVKLQGWVDSRRTHGKIVFIDLRDRSGLVQVVAGKDLGNVRHEDVVEIVGEVRSRPDEMVNDKIATGKIEVEAAQLSVLSHSRELPMPIDTAGYDIDEEVRLKYRYLDLRRPRMQRNIRLRSRLVDLARQYLFAAGFTEIETPLLTKSTPEGSRDFLVPSRLQPGKFYALPQSPQQYKQLLMAAGFERYFQIARCLRDEDLRADRGFEHTQIDIEMSFVNREQVMELDEGLITSVVESLGYRIKKKPFPVITYDEAMAKYGADKFDLRTAEDKEHGILAFAWVIDFPFFEKTDEGGWTFTHNPFSSPKPEHVDWLLNKQNIGRILTTQYDLVCNGYEVGGGSIRSHRPEMLEKVFEIMGYQPAIIQAQFGHMLEAFHYGVPPHGGLAHGVERLLMTLTGEPFLREVVAFPQTAGGKTSVMDAPSQLEDQQLRELGLTVLSSRLNGGESVLQKIVSLLEDKKVQFQLFEHQAVYTSEEAASVRQAPLPWGAKALVMIADAQPVMVVVPGDKKADVKILKSKFGWKDVRMATPEEVERVTSVKIGSVPPFGSIFGLPTYADVQVGQNENVVFNAGLHTKSIQIQGTDFLKAVAPIVENFVKS